MSYLLCTEEKKEKADSTIQEVGSTEEQYIQEVTMRSAVLTVRSRMVQRRRVGRNRERKIVSEWKV